MKNGDPGFYGSILEDLHNALDGVTPADDAAVEQEDPLPRKSRAAPQRRSGLTFGFGKPRAEAGRA